MKKYWCGFLIVTAFAIRDYQVKRNFEVVIESMKQISDNQRDFHKVDSTIVDMIMQLHK